jgi:multiple sugar transport system permease protein
LRIKRNIGQIFIYLIIIGGSFLFLLPLVWMVSTSLKGSVGLFDLPPKWIPEVFEWKNYVDAVNSFPFLRYTFNTVVITVLSVVGGVASSSFIAYSFAKLRWPGRNIWFVILITTMMLPPQVTMIPLFILFKEVGWINTYLPLTVPYFFGSAFYIFLMRQFYMTIPRELSEAAKIDGCSEFRIWWNIYVPLSKPAMATLAIFIFMFAWNDFLGPLIYLNNPDDFTLALGLRGFQQQFGTRWNVMMAASIIVMLPTLLLFFFFQKYFIKGVAMTGVKG